MVFSELLVCLMFPPTAIRSDSYPSLCSAPLNLTQTLSYTLTQHPTPSPASCPTGSIIKSLAKKFYPCHQLQVCRSSPCFPPTTSHPFSLFPTPLLTLTGPTSLNCLLARSYEIIWDVSPTTPSSPCSPCWWPACFSSTMLLSPSSHGCLPSPCLSLGDDLPLHCIRDIPFRDLSHPTHTFLSSSAQG